MSDRASPCRVLMTADAVGGVWTYALELARGLAPEGVQFTIATMGPRPSPAQRNEAAELPNVSLIESDYRLEWMQEPWSDVDAAGDWLGQIAADLAPDLIHLNGYTHAALPWSAPVLVVAHSCVVSWWRAVRETRDPEEWNEYRRRVARGLEAADFVVAPSQAMLSTLGDNYGRLPRKGVIPNGRDPRRFRSGRKEPFVFSAGRFWDESKNLAALETAARQIDWPVRVAGSNEERGAVVSLGKLSPTEVAAELSRASIFCLPARYEPFGLAALEAALSGCALVLGDIASLREVWDDAARFVDPNDATALARVLQELIDHPKEQEDLAQRAHSRAQRYSLEAMADRYLALYRGLIMQAQAVEEAAA
jgi:glycogen(starch) synthase